MKRVLFFSIVFWAIASPALAELTVQDLEKIRSIIKEEIADEIAPIKTEIASIKTENENRNHLYRRQNLVCKRGCGIAQRTGRWY